MKRHYSSEHYPMRGGAFVPVEELGYLLYPTKKENNHHLAHFASVFGKFVVSQCFRDLDRNQVIMPMAQHERLHSDWDQPIMPSFHDMMEVIDEACQQGEFLRYGSAHAPIYKPITPSLMVQCGIEYGLMT